MIKNLANQFEDNELRGLGKNTNKYLNFSVVLNKNDEETKRALKSYVTFLYN